MTTETPETLVENPAPESTPEDSSESLDDLIAEFGREVPQKPKTETPAAEPEPVEANGVDPVASLQQQFDTFRQERMLSDMQAQEDADAAAVIEDARKVVEGFPVPEDYAEAYVMRAYNLDAGLQEAWDNRHNSDAARERCERAVRRLMGDLRESAKKMPDPQATADREAVAWAVRGASTSPPPEQESDYSRMRNNDFANEVERKYGYRPAV